MTIKIFQDELITLSKISNCTYKRKKYAEKYAKAIYNEYRKFQTYHGLNDKYAAQQTHLYFYIIWSLWFMFLPWSVTAFWISDLILSFSGISIGKLPSLLTAARSAPCCIKYSAISSWPQFTVACNGVHPSRSSTFTSAPRFMRNFTISILLSIAACGQIELLIWMERCFNTVILK